MTILEYLALQSRTTCSESLFLWRCCCYRYTNIDKRPQNHDLSYTRPSLIAPHAARPPFIQQPRCVPPCCPHHRHRFTTAPHHPDIIYCSSSSGSPSDLQQQQMISPITVAQKTRPPTTQRTIKQVELKKLDTASAAATKTATQSSSVYCWEDLHE